MKKRSVVLVVGIVLAVTAVGQFLMNQFLVKFQQGGGGGWEPWKSYPELGDGPVTFTYSPLEENAYYEVIPLGHLNAPQHPIPTDHVYFVLKPSGFSSSVKAPADGLITMIQHSQTDWPEQSGYSGKTDEYQIFIAYSNTFRGTFGHLSELAPPVLGQAGELQLGWSNVNIPIHAGEVIGKTAKSDYISACLDMGTYDKDVNLNFIHPEKYGELTPHTVCPLDYFTSDVKTALYQKVERTAEPRGGKIDFDQPGRLVGNWFLDGHSVEDKGWIYELGFVYDVYDPSQIRIGIGGTLSIPEITTYGVDGNSPDPAEVSVESGTVIYRLSGTSEFGAESLTATILVQMVDNETIKVEGFDGHPPNPEFTSNAKYYTR